jgi:glyoxylase-like metal-dependent hydrolase (beta-lactamase superfamily II)
MAEGTSWVEVGDRVFVRRYAFFDQNIGVVLGRDAALVIDTRSTHAQAREILADLRRLTAAPVTVVVDTHGHFDHAYGNRVFRPATIWGHEGCVPFMARTGEARRARIAQENPEIAADLAEVVLDPPDRTFAEMAYVEVGGRRVELRHLGRGHTDHDIVVGVSDAGVLFAGDLIENGAVPSFGDAYPLDWPETASRLAELAVGVVVPGHGDHAGRPFVEQQAAAIARLSLLARSVFSGELTLDDAVAQTPFLDYPPEDVRRPLKRALAQLRGELA